MPRKKEIPIDFDKFEFERDTPMLSMEKIVMANRELARRGQNGYLEWLRTPNNPPVTSLWASSVRHHIDFDDDA